MLLDFSLGPASDLIIQPGAMVAMLEHLGQNHSMAEFLVSKMAEVNLPTYPFGFSHQGELQI
jgi:hypothetical protein